MSWASLRVLTRRSFCGCSSYDLPNHPSNCTLDGPGVTCPLALPTSDLQALPIRSAQFHDTFPGSSDWKTLLFQASSNVTSTVEASLFVISVVTP